MRRIFTQSIAIACLLALSVRSNAQTCSFSTSNPGAPATPQYDFTGGAQGFTLTNFAATTQSGNGFLRSSGGAGSTNAFSTPVFFIAPGTNQIIVAMDFRKQGSAAVTGVTVTATTASGTVPVCSQTGFSVSNSNFGTPTYFTLPTTNIPSSTNFRLNFTFTTTGDIDVDNFGTTANIAGTQATLPVRFAGLDAKTSGSSVNLSWNVDVELNVNRYEIERSADGVRFGTIGTVAAAGQRTYNYTDAAPIASAYYRIKSVDVDGKTGYSTIVAVKGAETSIIVKAFMTNLSTLTVQHDASTRGGRISVSTADGRLIANKIPAAGSQQTTIDMSTAKPGMYIVRYENAEGQGQTVKLIKN